MEEPGNVGVCLLDKFASTACGIRNRGREMERTPTTSEYSLRKKILG
jgi:hypothetical protein